MLVGHIRGIGGQADVAEVCILRVDRGVCDGQPAKTVFFSDGIDAVFFTEGVRECADDGIVDRLVGVIGDFDFEDRTGQAGVAVVGRDKRAPGVECNLAGKFFPGKVYFC